MKAGEGILGYKGVSVGFVAGGNSREFDDMVEAADMRCAKVMDTLIKDLGKKHPGQAAAIHHAYLHAVFKFKDLDLLLAQAKDALERGLKARGMW